MTLLSQYSCVGENSDGADFFSARAVSVVTYVIGQNDVSFGITLFAFSNNLVKIRIYAGS
jgi:hypothetical protein